MCKPCEDLKLFHRMAFQSSWVIFCYWSNWFINKKYSVKLWQRGAFKIRIHCAKMKGSSFQLAAILKPTIFLMKPGKRQSTLPQQCFVLRFEASYLLNQWRRSSDGAGHCGLMASSRVKELWSLKCTNLMRLFSFKTSKYHSANWRKEQRFGVSPPERDILRFGSTPF